MKFSNLMIATAVAALSSTAAFAAPPTAHSNSTYVNPVGGLNTGTPQTTASATFSIEGDVAPACILGANGGLNNIDFGTFGIYADGTSSVESAFTSVAARNGNSSTNLAGCNTANTVKIKKTNPAGLQNLAGGAGGYDATQFQAILPYKVSAVYEAPEPGNTALISSLGKFSVTETDPDGENSRSHGAWKSSAGFRVDIPIPAKALVAGTYTDTVTVTLEAAL